MDLSGSSMSRPGQTKKYDFPDYLGLSPVYPSVPVSPGSLVGPLLKEAHPILVLRDFRRLSARTSHYHNFHPGPEHEPGVLKSVPVTDSTRRSLTRGLRF